MRALTLLLIAVCPTFGIDRYQQALQQKMGPILAVNASAPEPNAPQKQKPPPAPQQQQQQSDTVTSQDKQQECVKKPLNVLTWNILDGGEASIKGAPPGRLHGPITKFLWNASYDLIGLAELRNKTSEPAKNWDQKRVADMAKRWGFRHWTAKGELGFMAMEPMEELGHDKYWLAVQMGDAIFVQVHLPFTADRPQAHSAVKQLLVFLKMYSATPQVIMGDFNALSPADIPTLQCTCKTCENQQRLCLANGEFDTLTHQLFLNAGFTDACYSKGSYACGLRHTCPTAINDHNTVHLVPVRLDYVLVSQSFSRKMCRHQASVLDSPPLEIASDHFPVSLQFVPQ